MKTLFHYRQRHSALPIIEAWRLFWHEGKFRVQVVLSVVALIMTGIITRAFFFWVQQRAGYTLYDPVLAIVSPSDFSSSIFILIYAAVITTVIYALRWPDVFLKMMQAYVLLCLFRLFTMLIVPLEPPPGLVVLQDPLVQTFFYPGYPVTKDLFFSGHVATLTLCFLVVRPLKVLAFLTLSILIVTAALLMIQHVHYTVDILFAPLFALASYRIAGMITPKKISVYST